MKAAVRRRLGDVPAFADFAAIMIQSGGADLDFHPDGVRCSLRIPAEDTSNADVSFSRENASRGNLARRSAIPYLL